MSYTKLLCGQLYDGLEDRLQPKQEILIQDNHHSGGGQSHRLPPGCRVIDLSALTVTPGIRFADSTVGDQKRIMTPEKAGRSGCDYIVVGRPITAAADPVAAYARCVKEFVG